MSSMSCLMHATLEVEADAHNLHQFPSVCVTDPV